MIEQKLILDPSSLPGPDDIAIRRLPNGLTLLARENFVTPAVYVAGYIRVGSRDESPDQAGLANLTAMLVTRGTESHSYDELNECIEGVGASLNVSSGTHTTNFNVKSLAEDTPTLLNLLADVLREPNFPEDQFERVKERRLTSLRERDHNPQSVASLLFSEQAYPEGHPYHTPNTGYVETVTPLRRRQLVEFFHEHYEPRNGAVAIVGAVPADDGLDLLEDTFGGWENISERQRKAIPQVERPTEVIRVTKEVTGKSQSEIVLGAPAMRAYHRDYLAGVLANSVLGVFGLMGRLGESVRDEQGLAYYARSALQRAPQPAPWYARAGVAPENVEQAIQTIKDEIERLGTEPVPDNELSDNKSYLTGSLPLRLETNEGVASAILNMIRYDLGLDYLQRFSDIVWELTAEDVKRVTATYLRPDACVIAVAGPNATDEG